MINKRNAKEKTKIPEINGGGGIKSLTKRAVKETEEKPEKQYQSSPKTKLGNGNARERCTKWTTAGQLLSI